MQIYGDSREHLYEELRRLDLLLNAQIIRHRSNPARAPFDEFRGLFISEEEIDLILERERKEKGEGRGAPPEARREVGKLVSAIERLEDRIDKRAGETLKRGTYLSLPHLAWMFQLTPFDVETLLISLAPELDLKYEKIYAYLQDDVTRKRPGVGLALDLLCDSLGEKVRARARLKAEAPLIKNRLITFPDDAAGGPLPMLARSMKIDDRILDHLLEIDALDERLLPFTRLIAPRASMEELVMPAELKEGLSRSFESLTASQNGRRSVGAFFFHGPAGIGKKFAAEALCNSTGIDLLIAEVPDMLTNGPDFSSLAMRLFREANLRSSAVYLDHAESLMGEDEKAVYAMRSLLGAMENFPGIAFAGSQRPWEANSDARSDLFYKFDFPHPGYCDRRQLWQTLLSQGGGRISPGVDAGEMAGKYSFTAGKIRSAISEAGHLASMRGEGICEITADDLYQACRAQSKTRLSSLARKITPLFTWEDIILPEDRLEQLREICVHIRQRQRVFGEWGFDKKTSLGKGIGILFAGPSGTGKTMAAEIIAGELGLELYKIDLSSVVSKYIGETEKNLSRIFQEAEQSNAILFFDEADAVFGKRSEVKDAHDRYANIEVNYLLQKMEEHEGMVILASNFQKNIDEAFVRRLRFIVEFPFPEEEYRYRIWKGVFPEDAPLSDDIDFEFAAKKLRIAGGNIKNIAIGAAFLAAENSGVLHMEHVIRATRREYQKMGRLCVKADFEQYFDLIEEGRRAGKL